MFEAVEDLVAEHADLETKLADPSVHADQANARKLNKRYAELTPIVGTYRSWKQTGEDIVTAREFAADEPDFAIAAAFGNADGDGGFVHIQADESDSLVHDPSPVPEARHWPLLGATLEERTP